MDRRNLARWALVSAPGVALLAFTASRAWGYSKDDAWISFRYARNWWSGDGLVFNPGDPIEGYTNFLWTVMMAPIAGSGLDPMPWAAILGVLFSLATVGIVVAAVRDLGGRDGTAAGAGLVFAAWPPVALWAVGGLEQGVTDFLSAATGLVAWRARHGDLRVAVGAGLLAAGVALSRPDGHAVAGVVLLALAIGNRRAGGAGLAALLGVLVPYHLVRVAWFGALLPNTFLVKGGSGFVYWREGLGLVGEMAVFGGWAVVAAMAVVGGVLGVRHPARGALAASVAIVAVFLAYLVKVGADELIWFRLFLPAWPYLVVLAALGAEWAAAFAGRAGPILGGIAAIALAAHNTATALPELDGFSDYNDDSRRFHADIGKFLTRHSAPGETVAFQDMGSTPFHAPDLAFVDTIGLVDHAIASMYHRFGVNPFLKDHWRGNDEGRRMLRSLYQEGREYLISRDPDWVVYVAFPPESERQRLKEAWRAAPDTNPAGPYLKDLTFYFGWAGDRRFRERYTYVKTWRRSSKYWITVWRRNDHVAQAPPEVVGVDSPATRAPISLGEAAFHGGRVDAEGWVAGESFVEGWWSADGPLPASTLVDVRVEDHDGKVVLRESHVPGDSLWPGDRWTAGAIVRDRVLVQWPRDLGAGTYRVAVRLRDRATDRLFTGPDAAAGWLPVGEIRLSPRPWWDPTRIAPTVPADQRARTVPEELARLDARPAAPRPADWSGPTLAVGGDVNLGRRQNWLTAHRGAEDALGSVAVLREADLTYVNLESVVATDGDFRVPTGEGGPYYYRGRPELLDVLTTAGIDVVGTANNHVGDYGPSAVVEQGAWLDQAGLGRPGSGPNREAACAPIIRRAGDLRVAFLTIDVTKAPFAATNTTPGTCYLPLDRPHALRALAPRVAAARAIADLVFLGVHWGPNNRSEPSTAMRAAARDAIDAGFDGILGSSAHLLHGIEVIDGRPVIYDAGNLLFDAKGDDVDSAVFVLGLSPDGVRQIRVVPVLSRMGRTDLAVGSDGAARVLAAVRARSAELGTDVWVGPEDALVALPDPPARPRPPVVPADPGPPAAPVRTPPLAAPPPGCVADAVPPDAARPPVTIGPLTLIGARISPSTLTERAVVGVETWWRVDAPPPDVLIDARVVPVGRGPVWTGDHDGCDWSWPVSRWVPGVVYVDRYAIRPPKEITPGEHRVRIGVAPELLARPDVSVDIGEILYRPQGP